MWCILVIYPGIRKVGFLRADVNHVVFPGDSIARPTRANFHEDTSIAVEPRVENNKWPSPCIVENKNGFFLSLITWTNR